MKLQHVADDQSISQCNAVIMVAVTYVSSVTSRKSSGQNCSHALESLTVRVDMSKCL